MAHREFILLEPPSISGWADPTVIRREWILDQALAGPEDTNKLHKQVSQTPVTFTAPPAYDWPRL